MFSGASSIGQILSNFYSLLTIFGDLVDFSQVSSSKNWLFQTGVTLPSPLRNTRHSCGMQLMKRRWAKMFSSPFNEVVPGPAMCVFFCFFFPEMISAPMTWICNIYIYMYITSNAVPLMIV